MTFFPHDATLGLLGAVFGRCYSGMLRLVTLYLEFEFSANSNITTCRFSVWVLLEAILFIPNLCSMIPQINSIDSCHSNLSSLMHRAPKYGGVSLRFRKTRVI